MEPDRGGRDHVEGVGPAPPHGRSGHRGRSRQAAGKGDHPRHAPAADQREVAREQQDRLRPPAAGVLDAALRSRVLAPRVRFQQRLGAGQPRQFGGRRAAADGQDGVSGGGSLQGQARVPAGQPLAGRRVERRGETLLGDVEALDENDDPDLRLRLAHG